MLLECPTATSIQVLSFEIFEGKGGTLCVTVDSQGNVPTNFKDILDSELESRVTCRCENCDYEGPFARFRPREDEP